MLKTNNNLGNCTLIVFIHTGSKLSWHPWCHNCNLTKLFIKQKPNSSNSWRTTLIYCYRCEAAVTGSRQHFKRINDRRLSTEVPTCRLAFSVTIGNLGLYIAVNHGQYQLQIIPHLMQSLLLFFDFYYVLAYKKLAGWVSWVNFLILWCRWFL